MNYLKTLGAAVVAAVTFGNIATAETTWVMASGYPDDSFFTQNIRTFIEEVEAASDGELKIDLRSNGELIKLDAIRRAVQAGQIQLGEIRFGVYGNESPMFTLDSLPNVAGNYDDAWKLMEAQKPWFDKVFGDAGMQVISYAPWPGQGFYTKFDVTDGSQFEVPQAFSTGLIEALFTSGQTGTDIQAWDYVSNFTYTGSMHNKNAIIISERALSALSPELQEAIIAAGERATERAWELSKEATEIKRQELIDAGMVVTDASPELQAKLEEIGKAMVEEWSASASPEEVDVLNNYLAAQN